MVKYKDTVKGIFLSRPNRFIANVQVEGREERVHVKNTGRCRELLIPGVEVVLAPGNNPGRKTKYDLISVYKKSLGWVNIDSQVPNTLVREWLNGGKSTFGVPRLIKPECKYGNSRVDFYLECGERRIFIEVKGCTLEIEGKGYFPDAPTLRGVKHLHELAQAVWEGYECYVAFVIALPGIREVYPNADTHQEFATALREAQEAGVRVLYLPCNVQGDSIEIIE